MTVLGILQARMSSRRLPGKVLQPILGAPMLLRQIERIRRARRLDGLVVATSTAPEDDALAQLCDAHGVACHRGPLDDVLTRVWQAAAPYRPAHVVRLTGDCPLADPALIDAVIARHLDSGADYTSNCLPPTYPDGLDVEVVRIAALEAAWREAASPAEREHVTLFIHRRPQRFRCENLAAARDLSHLRWTVDEPDDLELVRRIYQALYPAKPDFGSDDILAWLDANPAWARHNMRHPRNEGLARALASEATGKDR
ncbi:MAG: spore coat protein [Alphaproteobacteria bacterium]|nr:MAG: spore coat protein [Alphaproteobacteria bacterium]